MSLCRLICKFPATVRTWCPIIVLVGLILIPSTITCTSGSSSTIISGCPHGGSELFGLCLPLSFIRHLDRLVLPLWNLLLSCIWFSWCFSPYLLQNLFLFACNSVCLTVKYFPFLLEYLFTNLRVLLVSFVVEGTPTTLAGCQIHISWSAKCFWA